MPVRYPCASARVCAVQPGEDVGNCVCIRGRVDRHRDHAGHGNRQIGHYPFSTVLAEYRHLVAGIKAKFCKRSCHTTNLVLRRFERNDIQLAADRLQQKITLRIPGGPINKTFVRSYQSVSSGSVYEYQARPAGERRYLFRVYNSGGIEKRDKKC